MIAVDIGALDIVAMAFHQMKCETAVHSTGSPEALFTIHHRRAMSLQKSSRYALSSSNEGDGLKSERK